MWNKIENNKDVESFMKKMQYFHDCCVKEMKYVSGSYVDEELAMYPINDCRTLRILLQRQVRYPSMIELEFCGLRKMVLCPIGEEYTSEIFEASLVYKKGLFYWCDSSENINSNRHDIDGILIISEELRWRGLDAYPGKEEVYIAREF